MRRITRWCLALLGGGAGLLGSTTLAHAADACVAPIISPLRMNAVLRQWQDRTLYREPTAVLLRYTFTAPDTPPTVEILFAAGADRLADVMAEEAKDLRAPCVASAGPVKSHQFQRVSVYAPGDRVTQKERRLQEDIGLADLVRIVKDLKSQKVRFDLRDMACPFTVDFAPFQPYAPNDARESGERIAARAPFLDWIRSLTLDFPKEMMGTAIGQKSRLHVPCAVLDLS